MVKFPLHFVGNATYDLQLFVREAKKYGVSRALPVNVATKLKIGDIVLLAMKVKEGAKVFGYFVFSGYTVPDEVAKEVVKDVPAEKLDVHLVIERGCGSYVLSGRYIIDEKHWDTLNRKLRELAYKTKFKLFVNGVYYPLKPFILHNVKFTRSIVYVDLDWNFIADRICKAEVNCMKNYERVYYRTKHQKTIMLQKFSENLTRWIKT